MILVTCYALTYLAVLFSWNRPACMVPGPGALELKVLDQILRFTYRHMQVILSMSFSEYMERAWKFLGNVPPFAVASVSG